MIEADRAPLDDVLAPRSDAEPTHVNSDPTCWRCAAVLRDNARFCGRCGLSINVHDFITTLERPRVGLGLALATYFGMLAVVVVMLLVEFESHRATLFVDLGIIVAGIGLFIAFWRELGPLLGLPTRLDINTAVNALAIMSIIFGAMQLFMAAFPGLFTNVIQGYRADVDVVFTLVQIGPVTALGEELIFRGVILRGLRNTFPDRTAIIVSAAMFASIHNSPLNYFHTGALGLVLGWLTVRTTSIWPAVILHTAWNTIMVLLEL